MKRLVVFFLIWLANVAIPQAAVADAVEVVIGGQSAQIELPDGYCAMSAFDSADARLIRFLIAVNRGINTVHLAFAECAQLAAWRLGSDVVLFDYGYVATPINLESTPVNMTRPDYVEAIAQSFNAQGVSRLERGLAEGEERVRELVPDLEIGATQHLGIISEDDNALYLGLVQKLKTGTDASVVVLGSFANTTLNNRATTMYLYTEFSDKALDGLVARNRDLVDRTIATNEP